VREKLKLNDEERQRFLAGLHTAAHDEPQMRAIRLAMLLIEQAELAAQPLRPEEVDRLIERERQRAEHLRRAEFVDTARLFEQLAAKLARDHERDFCTEAEREKAMIRTAATRLIRDFDMRGDRLVAGLVSAALERAISSRHVRQVATGR
jgi:hypothetical protein